MQRAVDDLSLQGMKNRKSHRAGPPAPSDLPMAWRGLAQPHPVNTRLSTARRTPRRFKPTAPPRIEPRARKSFPAAPASPDRPQGVRLVAKVAGGVTCPLSPSATLMLAAIPGPPWRFLKLLVVGRAEKKMCCGNNVCSGFDFPLFPPAADPSSTAWTAARLSPQDSSA